MSDIARAAGLQQSSLYYWFRRKELILQATFALNRVPLELFRLIRFDTLQLCLSPCDLNEIEGMAEQHPEVFSDFWTDRQRLHDWVVTLVNVGIEEGQFVECDTELMAISLLSFDDGIQKRFRFRDQHSPGSASAFTHRQYEASEIAEFVAATSLRALLRRPGDLARIQRQAAAYQDA
jgi:AcrR family transcriptional regulator